MLPNTLLLFSISILINFFTKNAEALEHESIVGGFRAPAGSIRYHAFINIVGRSYCSGSIIHDYFIVTAAHCVAKDVDNIVDNPIIITTGAHDLINEPDLRIIRQVKRIHIHSGFNLPNNINDIAVLELETSLYLDTNSRIEPLRLSQTQDYLNENATVAGYGWKKVIPKEFVKPGEDEYVGKPSHLLRFATTQILPRSICQEKYTKRRFFFVNEVITPIIYSHICARMIQHSPLRPEGVCSGDSGAPLVYKGNILIGVLSFGPHDCDERSMPGVYIRVSSFRVFIENIINGHPDEYAISKNVTNAWEYFSRNDVSDYNNNAYNI